MSILSADLKPQEHYIYIYIYFTCDCCDALETTAVLGESLHTQTGLPVVQHHEILLSDLKCTCAALCKEEANSLLVRWSKPHYIHLAFQNTEITPPKIVIRSVQNFL